LPVEFSGITALSFFGNIENVFSSHEKRCWENAIVVRKQKQQRDRFQNMHLPLHYIMESTRYPKQTNLRIEQP
jgi:hypothetical protein